MASSWSLSTIPGMNLRRNNTGDVHWSVPILKKQKNLTTQSIIDIWGSTLQEEKEQIIKSKREGGGDKGTIIFE